MSGQSTAGSCPVTTLVQLLPELSQVWQVPVQSTLQQKPLLQLPCWQSALLWQRSPNMPVGSVPRCRRSAPPAPPACRRSPCCRRRPRRRSPHSPLGRPSRAAALATGRRSAAAAREASTAEPDRRGVARGNAASPLHPAAASATSDAHASSPAPEKSQGGATSEVSRSRRERDGDIVDVDIRALDLACPGAAGPALLLDVDARGGQLAARRRVRGREGDRAPRAGSRSPRRRSTPRRPKTGTAAHRSRRCTPAGASECEAATRCARRKTRRCTWRCRSGGSTFAPDSSASAPASTRLLVPPCALAVLIAIVPPVCDHPAVVPASKFGLPTRLCPSVTSRPGRR